MEVGLRGMEVTGVGCYNARSEESRWLAGWCFLGAC